MYRLSNHWGRLANSKWRLVTSYIETESKYKWGYAAWESFYPDNSIDKLYFIQPDFTNNTVNYQHKNAPQFDNKAVLRTSFETAKKIKQVLPASGIGCVFELVGVSNRFKAMQRPSKTQLYARVLQLGMGYIFYGFCETHKPDSWRMV